MSRWDVISSNLQAMGGRRFRFEKHCSKQTFVCAICHGRGRNGYVLKDDQGTVTVGQDCFKNYFCIHPQQVADSPLESPCNCA
jgi:hypothetical protein